jgi:hypothetical protein
MHFTVTSHPLGGRARDRGRGRKPSGLLGPRLDPESLHLRHMRVCADGMAGPQRRAAGMRSSSTTCVHSLRQPTNLMCARRGVRRQE